MAKMLLWLRHGAGGHPAGTRHYCRDQLVEFTRKGRRQMKIPHKSADAIRGTTSAKRHELIEKVRSGEILPEQARHIAVGDILRELPKDLLPAIAELAKIPESRCEAFNIGVLNALFDCWETQENIDMSLELQENKSFGRAVDALKSARQALAQMDESYRQEFWWPVVLVEQDIDRFLLAALGQLEPKRQTRRQGRPVGKVKGRASQEFVFQLLDCAKFAEGNLTFEKHQGKGTLKKALKKLAPFLPRGIDPDKLPHATLQRIKSAQQRRYRVSTSSGPKIQ